jgi:hypothetical protein
MPNTFTLIASSTVGSGGAANIDFTSIPSTYTDVCLVLSGRSDTTDADQRKGVTLKFNGSTSSYSFRNLYGVGSSAGSGNGSAQANLFTGTMPASNATASTFSNTSIYVPNYAGSAQKSVSIDSATENNSSTYWFDTLVAGLWTGTAAITQITLTPDAGNFVQYSTAYLYGVKNA